MIKNIKRLKQFGIFRDFKNHTNAKAKDFGRYNLFYGWNGSGKSTLSSVFDCVKNKALSEKFSSSEFTISIDGDADITQANIAESDLNIHTFNRDFINENISWDDSDVVKSILLIDKAKIKESGELEKQEKEQEADSGRYNKESAKIKKLDKSISNFCSQSAYEIKELLLPFDATDKYYQNYDKSKFETFIGRNSEAIKTDASFLDEDKVTELKNTAKSDQKNLIHFTQQIIRQATFTEKKERLDNLLKTSVTNETIQRLVEHGDISSWVEGGLNLHKHHDASQCEFCGNTITEERIQQLEAHFNDEYKDFQEKLATADNWLKNLYIQPPDLPMESDFYEEYKEEYKEACAALKKATENLNEEISVWHAILGKKIKNPFETSLTVESIQGSSIEAFNDALIAIDAIAKKHNHKLNNFKEETKKAKEQLELHYATTKMKAFGYYDKIGEVEKCTEENNALNDAIEERKEKIQTLKDSLSNESLGAEQFNESLHRFLGHSELTLQFNPRRRGYEILRNNSEPGNSESVNRNLSEGEKTAIAFVYFITKLKENDNKIEDTIVVIDDPVSSFDSNYLFHAFSFMKMNCEEAKQLFVLTHNFTFFKPVRDWISNKNKDNNPDIANFYVIETNNEKPRASTYANAGVALTSYNSEYHYIFARLYSLKNQSLKNQQTSKADNHFLAANCSRKLLESFLSFKFPKNRGNFFEVLKFAIDKVNPKDERKDKIYKFVNKYSHNNLIEIDEDSAQNLMGEINPVIEDIFRLIKKLDETHYKEMVEVAKKDEEMMSGVG